ncbi:hypothetical protein [uncultured Clostridium sp.]|uniref:hypothetical protein n=1 Tax=uncultured Clostridium sp. TaxID=59620 RepID=UPI00272F2D7E|nr:hypothetical protein [uncultured Clostridium sp.]
MDELPDKIIGLDQIRINRGLDKICKCRYRKFILDTTNKKVLCASCGAEVEAYEALCELAEQDEEKTRQLEILLEQKKKLDNYKPWLKVIKELETKYRGYKAIPMCPRCKEPFYLEEISSWYGKEVADFLIEKFKEKKNDKIRS